MTRSSLCEGWVSHRRTDRPGHGFRYPVFLTLLDLDELSGLDRRLRLFGHNRRRPVAFRDADHLEAGPGGVRSDLRRTVRAAGHEMPGGRVEILTNCRILGYVFNPISVFSCYDEVDRLALAVGEVNNTYGDRHSYVLPGEDPGFDGSTKKLMHVSPFLQPDAGTYRWQVPAPSERVALGIDLTRAGEVVLAARLSLARKPLTDRALLSALLRYPFMTLQVIAAIHFEALRLWGKGARFWDRPAYDPDLARGGPA